MRDNGAPLCCFNSRRHLLFFKLLPLSHDLAAALLLMTMKGKKDG